MGAKRVYTAEARSLDELISMLESQGLEIADPQRAKHIFRNVSYTRLKNYLVPLMADRSTHRFRSGASFELAYALYGFDRRLRELVFHELEKVEISIRTHMAYASNDLEAGYWYLNPAHFKSVKRHAWVMKKFKYELQRTDNEGIINFYRKYSNEFPPSWLALEASSLGMLSVMYDEMLPGGLKAGIAESYGLSEYDFASWLRHLVAVRNHCAHHNRLWDNTLRTRASIPEKPSNLFPRLNADSPFHLYYTCCVIKYLQNTVKPCNSFATRLKALIDSFPMVDDSAMGFPAGWRNDPFWQDGV